MRDRIASVCCACARTCSHSSSSSLPGLSSTALLTPSLPTSCSSAPRFSQRRRGADRPSAAATWSTYSATRVAVAAGEGALRIHHLAEGRGDVVEVVVVQRHAQPARLQRQHRVVEVGECQRRPRTAARQPPVRRPPPAPGRTTGRRGRAPRAARPAGRRPCGTRPPPAPAARCAHTAESTRRPGRAACRGRSSARPGCGCPRPPRRESAAAARCRRRGCSASASARARSREPLRMMFRMARSRCVMPAPRPVWLKTKRSTCGRLSPTLLKSRLNCRSSARYSSQMRAALLLQPRSLSSSV